jgi:allophanate hydrolase
VSETVAEIVHDHRVQAGRPQDTVARTYRRIQAIDDPAVFISLRPQAEVEAEARSLAASGRTDLPLYGVPVAIKDNIDVAGLPTTAACPAYAYQPQQDAAAVARLRRAGALVIGKTNLDQFATGLVGVRSPYGVPRNPFNPAMIPGGSSSGSAVAVATGLVPLALGTDTAGSGRIPAGLNNIVGLKPSVGLVPTAGVVPACRSLDCVSVFALTTDDAFAALAVMAAAPSLGSPGALPPAFRLAVPRDQDLTFFGDARAEAAFAAGMALAAATGATLVEIDLAPFLETARLLYDGPWLAERWAAVGDFVARQPDAVHPVTRAIITRGADISAGDTFRAFYRLAELREAARAALAGIDALMVPTAPAAYTVAELAAEPVRLNSNLGTYTNFVNLLDLCGLAVPAVVAADGTPFGITLVAPAGQDAWLATIGRALHAHSGLALGALGIPQPPLAPLAPQPGGGDIAIAVAGAHLSGMPLNGELRALGARFLAQCTTAPDYRLFALSGAPPAKPGLLRVAPGQGGAIEIELWTLTAEAFGRFVAAVPAPLAIGTVRLADGRSVKGFLVEGEAAAGARDITSFGGWRAFVNAKVPA